MTKITPSNPSSIPPPPSAAAFPAPTFPTGTQPAAGLSQAPRAGKRPRGAADFLERASQQPRTDDPGKLREPKPAIEQWMDGSYKLACAALVELLCGKPDFIDGTAGDQKAEVERLVGTWVQMAEHIPRIGSNGLGTQKKLIMTRLLGKLVGSDAVTYHQARDMLTTVSWGGQTVRYLTGKAQAYCRDLTPAESSAGRQTRQPMGDYACMVLSAVHEELTLKGYQMADLINIANKKSNFTVLLLLASDVMNQSPFTADSGHLSTADRQSSCISKLKIARQEGSVATILAMVTQFPALNALGVTADQALTIAANAHGYKNSHALLTHHHALLATGFSNEQVVAIASYRKGDVALELVAANFEKLKKMEFSHEQIVQLVNPSIGGPRNLQLTLACAEALPKNAEQEIKTAEPVPDCMMEDGAHLAEAPIELIPHEVPADGTLLQEVLNDADLLAALDRAFHDPEPIPFSAKGASREQITQVLLELDEAGAL